MQLPLNYFFHSMTRFEFDQIHSNHHDSAGPAAFEPRPMAKVNGQSIQLPTSKAGDFVLAQIEYDEAALKALIRRMHLKVTPQRMAILRHLVDGPRHTTVQELYDKVVELVPLARRSMGRLFVELRSLAERVGPKGTLALGPSPGNDHAIEIDARTADGTPVASFHQSDYCTEDTHHSWSSGHAQYHVLVGFVLFTQNPTRGHVKVLNHTAFGLR